VRAARFVGPNQPIELTDVTEPRPGPNDVVVRVEACGICASDLHFIEGEMPLPVPQPLTMGHEASGTVSAVGAEVPVWRECDSVSLVAGKGCHRCHRCAAGLMEECRNPQLLGIHFDGGWAEQVVVSWYLLAAVPEGVSFEHAAIACDAVATPFAALSERGVLQAGERVGLWGIGGLGTHAVQIARLLGASLVAAIDPLPEARERAMGPGADLALDPDEDVPEEIRRATGGRGLDMAVDLVGRSAVIKQAMHALGRGGRVVVVGQSLEPVEAGPLLVLSFLGLGVLGHLGYQKRHLERVLDLIASGRLDLSASFSARVPLDDVNEGVARPSAKTDAPVRVVVLPGGSHPS
jgi:2-desacetyl-2-hydroxyethyl bacteriochlorophyllide A dehydrogenase